MTLLFVNPGCLQFSHWMLMPFYFSFKIFKYLFWANREGSGEGSLARHIPTWSFHYLSNSNVTLPFMCMGRIPIYTPSASFEIASISLKSKAFSTFGNYLWNPLTWLTQYTQYQCCWGFTRKEMAKFEKKRKERQIKV